MPQFGPHRRGEREMLRACRGITAAGQREAETELRIVVTRARLHDLPETRRRRLEPSRVELGPPEGLQHAPGARLCLCRAFQELGGGRRAAPAKQLKAPLVPRVRVTMRFQYFARRARIFLRAGIPVARRCF